jgi:hypothetical protein
MHIEAHTAMDREILVHAVRVEASELILLAAAQEMRLLRSTGPGE